MRNKLISVVGVNPPADIASGRIAEVRRRSSDIYFLTSMTAYDKLSVIVSWYWKVGENFGQGRISY